MTQLQKMHKLQRTKSAPSNSRVQATPPPLPGPSILRTTCDTYDLPLPTRNEVGPSVGVSVSFAPLPETEIFGRRGKHRLGVIARSDILNRQRQRRRDGRSSMHEEFNQEQAYEQEQEQEHGYEQPYERPPPPPPMPQRVSTVRSGPVQEPELHARMSKMSLVGEGRRGSSDTSPQTLPAQDHRNHQRSQISFKFWKRTNKASPMSSAEERNEPAPQVGSRRPAPDHDNHVAPANRLPLDIIPTTLPVLSMSSYEKSLHDPAGDQDSKDSSTPSTPKRPDLSIPHGISDHTPPLLSEIALITYSSQGTLVATVTDSRNSFPDRKQHLDNLHLVQL